MTKIRTAPGLMFAWLLLGYAVIHIVILAWGVTIIQSVFANNSPSEHLQVFEDDGPLIQSYNRGLGQITYRQMDGTVVPGTIGMHVNGAALDHSFRGIPYSWQARLSSFIDFQSPTVNWYLVAPPDYSDTAYFVGYEQLSRRLVGYLDTKGFSSLEPPPERRFHIRTSAHHAFNGSVAATQSPYLQQAYEPSGGYFQRDIVEVANADLDAVWILSEGTLYEIRLGTRKVRVLIENHPEFQTLASSRFKRDGKTHLQLLTRTDQRVIVIDPATLQEQSIPLESRSPQEYWNYYQMANGQRLIVSTLTSTDPASSKKSLIRWLNEDGSVERSEEVSLASPQTNNLDLTLGAALILPAPALPLAVVWIAPLIEPQILAKSESYFTRVQRHLAMFSGWLMISLAVGVLAGAACRQRELNVFGNESWVWPVVVGLCGWFGWIGYSFLRPLPARLPSGQWLPAQPEPNRPLGTEIFA